MVGRGMERTMSSVRRRVALVLAIAALAVTGCGSDDAPAETTPSTVAPTLAPTTLPPTTAAPATTEVPIASLVDDCVEFVPIGAYLGDDRATFIWNAVAFDMDLLQEACAGLVSDQPDTLREIGAQLEEYEATVATAPDASTPSDDTIPDGATPTGPTTTGTEPDVDVTTGPVTPTTTGATIPGAVPPSTT